MHSSETLPTTAAPAVPEAAPSPVEQPTPTTTPPGSPAWVRPALGALLLATALLYLWGLSASGWANSFYSAAAQAGSESWKALFYGSSDAANSITVDKPPAAMWIMGLSVRVFGLNSWAILVPQALAGVASVGVLFATVRRWYGPAAGLLAGTVARVTAGRPLRRPRTPPRTSGCTSASPAADAPPGTTCRAWRCSAPASH